MDVFQDNLITAVEAGQFAEGQAEFCDQAGGPMERGIDVQPAHQQGSVLAIGLGIEAADDILVEQDRQDVVAVAALCLGNIAFQAVVEGKSLL